MKMVNRFILFSFLFIIAVLVPASAFAQLVPCGTGEEGVPSCTLCHLYVLAKNVIDFGLFDLALPIAIIMLLIGGIILLTSMGSPEKLTRGKAILVNTLLGLVIAFAAWIIIATLLGTLGFNLSWADAVQRAWYEFPDQCAEGINALPSPSPSESQFCYSEAQGSCSEFPSEAECTTDCATLYPDGVCMAGCPAPKKFCSDGVNCSEFPDASSCTADCENLYPGGSCYASCPGESPEGEPVCEATSDYVEVQAMVTCTQSAAAAAGLQIDNITTGTGSHTCNLPDSVSCHYGGPVTSDPQCNGTAHAADFSLVPEQSIPANFQTLLDITITCGASTAFCESSTERFTTCTDSSINHVHANDAYSLNCGCD